MEDSDVINDDSVKFFNNTHHRGQVREQIESDIVHPSRLSGFSDAVFATAATLLVIPIKRFELAEGQSLSGALLGKWGQFLIFLIGFLIICRIWESRIIRQNIINKVDDMIVALSLLSMMVTTFLPFSIALESYFSQYSISILLNSLLLLALELIEVVVFIYSFNMNPYLLNERVQLLDPVELKAEKCQLYVKFVADAIILILAASLSYTSALASRVLIFSVLLTPWLIRLIAKRTLCRKHCQQCKDYQSPYEVVTGSINKERIECFSDAAIAIIATLLVLDLTTEEFPTIAEVNEKGLEYVLRSMGSEFISYIASYAIIAFLWSVNHSILHHVKVFNPTMIFINKLFLAFVAYTPFVTNLLQRYSGHSSKEATIAVRFGTAVLFMAGIFNVLLLITAVWNKETTMYEWAWPKNRRDNRSNPVHTYLLLKTLILPCVCFVTFLTGFSTHYTCYVTFRVAIFVVPVTFICLKIAYTCHCRSRQPNGNTFLVPRETNSPDLLVPSGLPRLSDDSHISLTNRRGIEDETDSE